MWNDIPDVAAPNGALCQYDPSGCDPGWTYFEHSRKCYKSITTYLNRADAIKACKESKPTANLVSIPDMTTNAFVQSMVSWRSWIGLQKVNGEWIWPNGKRTTLNNWVPNQPSGDGTFVEMFADKEGPGKWNDLSSSHKRGAVCQYDNNKGKFLTVKPLVHSDFCFLDVQCETGWTYSAHNRICYRSSETQVRRSDAVNACKAWKSNAVLASIPDKKTNDFVLGFVKWRSWISLEKRGSHWYWADGTKATYLYWGGGGPSGDGSYVELCRDTDWTPGVWNDLASSHKRGYVCQYSPH